MKRKKGNPDAGPPAPSVFAEMLKGYVRVRRLARRVRQKPPQTLLAIQRFIDNVCTAVGE